MTLNQLQVVVASPPALQAMHHRVGGVHPSRFRPPVHITIWS